MIDEIIAAAGAVEGVYAETPCLQESFMEIAGRFAGLPGTVVLASGGEHDAARYHILAAKPWLTYQARGRRLSVQAGSRRFSFRGDPLEFLRSVLSAFAVDRADARAPTQAGLFGYLAYDLKDHIEDLPKTAVDDLFLPQLCLYAPSLILFRDRRENRFRLCIPVRKQGGHEEVRALRKWFFDRLRAPADAEKPDFSGGGKGFFSPFTRRTYMETVEKIRNYIVSGHIYQVNLSQRFETDFHGSAFAMFARLFSAAPAPFYAYVHAGDHWIVSTSPERFLLRQGRRVETRPIKGTRPRGKDPAEDRRLAEELKNSPKDDAELSMIVDLMRNDLGRVCAAGTVAVAEHKRLEAYPNVFHLVSVVRGLLAAGKDAVDLIRATFPGGSVTGCPRIRAMEIIDEMEPCRRHVYTGSIGYIGFDGVMDLSIAIRTATIARDRMFFSVGGGVVFDSEPADEYEETLHKGRSVMSVFNARKPAPAPEARVWQDGMLVPASGALVPVSEPGFQYGWGFFETIRVDRGRPHLLERHMQRFFRAWRALFNTPVPELTWAAIIDQVLEANGLGRQVCAVKILAAARDAAAGFHPPRLVVSAVPYVHRLERAGKQALDLAVYPHPRQSPLAGHKTLNYLYYLLAGRWALETGADEAVILNPGGSLSETNTANLLLVQGRTVLRPESPHVLAGVMEGAVLEILSEDGFSQKTGPLMPERFFESDAVIVTNSLMGPVGAGSVDGRKIACDPEWIGELRRRIFSRHF